MVKVFMLAVLLAACEGQPTTNFHSVKTGGSCFVDQAVQEEVKILREMVTEIRKSQQTQQDKFNSELEDLKEKFSTADSKLDEVDGRLSTADSKFEEVDDRLGTADSKFEQVDGRLNTADIKLEEVDGRLSTADSKFQQVDGRLSTADSKFQQVDGRLSTVEDSPFVGFTAWSYTGATFSDGDTVRFDRVLFNYGSAYDSSTSKFTCPFSGIYSVNVRIEEDGDHDDGVIVHGMLDSDKFLVVHVHKDSTEHGASSSSAMVGCVTGQTIYVKADDTVDLEDNFGERNIFSVYLLQTMPDNEVRAGQLL